MTLPGDTTDDDQERPRQERPRRTLAEWESIYARRAETAADDLSALAALSVDVLAATSGEHDGDTVVTVTLSVRGAERLLREWSR